MPSDFFAELALAADETAEEVFHLGHCLVRVFDDEHVGGGKLDALIDGLEAGAGYGAEGGATVGINGCQSPVGNQQDRSCNSLCFDFGRDVLDHRHQLLGVGGVIQGDER